MKVHLDCYPCFLKQTIIALRLGTKDNEKRGSILKHILNDIGKIDTSKTPAHTTTFLHREIRTLLGKDPFRGIKSEYNQIALKLYPFLKNRTETSPDPLWTASRLAIAGNVIDFGIFTSVDIEGTIERALTGPITVDDYPAFRDEISQTDKILYLLDNAGEIVFDRILIETLISLGKKVTAVVKGADVINDSTLHDASETQLTEICEVIGNGSDAVGTILEWTSQDFQDSFKNATLIISKGQGNFETLLDSKKRIFFLFQSKCDVVSKELGLSKGSMLLKKPGLPIWLEKSDKPYLLSLKLRRSLAGPLCSLLLCGFASLTTMLLSIKLLPFNMPMAFCASTSEFISTKPKPLGLPVTASFISFVDTTSPALEKSSLRSSSDAWNEIFPT